MEENNFNKNPLNGTSQADQGMQGNPYQQTQVMQGDYYQQADQGMQGNPYQQTQGMQGGYYQQADQGMQGGYYQQADQGMQGGYYQQADQGMQGNPYQQADQGMQGGYYQQADQGMQGNPYQQADQGMQGNPYQQTQGMQGDPYQQTMVNAQDNPYFQPAPTGPSNGGKKPGKVKKPMSKGKLAGIIGGSVAAVAVIVCGIIFIPKLFKSDKDRVVDAFKDTFNQEYMASSSPLDDVLGISEINKGISEKGGEAHVGAEIVELAGDSTLAGLGISFDGAMDKVNKKLVTNATLTNAGSELVTLKFLADDKMTYLTIPDAIDGYIAINNNNVVSSFNNSILASDNYAGKIEGVEDFNLDYFSDSETAAENGIYAPLYESFAKAGDKLWDDVKVKSKGNESIELGDSKAKCKKYEVTFSEESLEDALTEVSKGYLNLLSSDAFATVSGDLSASDLENVMSQLETMIPSLVSGDFTVNVYVKDGKVVCISAKDKFNMMGYAINYDTYIKFTGKKNVLSSIDSKFAFSAAGQSVEIVFNGGSEEVSDGVDTKYNLSVSAAGTTVCELVFDRSYKSSDNSVTATGTLTVASETFDFSANGEFSNIVKGQSYDLNIDSLSINYAGNKVGEIKCSYGISTLSNDIETVDTSKEVVNLFECTETDLMTFVTENQAGLMSVAGELSQLSGLFGGSGYGTIDDLDSDPYTDDDYDDIDGDDYDDYDDIDDTDDDTNDPSNTVFEFNNGTTVKVNSCIDGFECDFAGDYTVSFEDEEYSYISFSPAEGIEDINAQLDNSLTFLKDNHSDSITNIDEKLTTEIDGRPVYYSKVSVDSYGSTVNYYYIYMLVNDNNYISVDAYIYADDTILTDEELFSALGNQYITITE